MSLTGFELPEWSAVLTHYREPRVLRTRATATAFRVRSADVGLIVTTGAGNDRSITPIEMSRAWPFVQRTAPKSEWKRISDNSSYIEAIYDDLRDALGASAAGFDQALRDGLAREQVNDQADEIRRLKGRLAELRDQDHELADLKAQVHQMTAAASDVERLRAELADALEAQRELTDLREKLARSVARIGDLERDLLAAQAAVADVHHSPRHVPDPQPDAELDGLRQERDRLESAVIRARGTEATLKQVSEKYDRALNDAAAAMTRIKQLEEQVAGEASLNAKIKELERRVESAPPVRPVDVTVNFNLGTKSFGAGHRIDPEAADRMRRAAVVVLTDPDSAVSTCRQVLEHTVREIRKVRMGDNQGLSFSAILDDLHRDPAVPIADWHLAKNLWNRASAVVHEGGSTAEVALWIWLGTMQVAELLPSARAAGAKVVG